MPVRRGVHQIPQITIGLTPLQVSGSASAGRVICGTDLAKCVSVPGDFLRPQRALSQAFTSFGRVGFIAWRLRRPNKGNADGAVGIFGKCRAREGYGPAPGPTMGLVPHLPVGWGGQQMQITIGLTLLQALRPAVLSAARIWPSVSRYLEISFGLRGPSPQAFTSFGRVGLIALCLRRP